MKRSLRKGKRDWINSRAHVAEDAAQQGQMKGVHDTTKKLCNEKQRKVRMVRRKEGRLLVKARCREHFMEILTRPVHEVAAEVDETNIINDST